MAFKMKGWSPLNQKKIWKEGEDYVDKDGNYWSWDTFTNKHNKIDIDLRGVPAKDYKKEIKRQDPDFKFPGEKKSK